MNNLSDNKNICLKLWGVRGSLPAPGPQTKLFGGNTSCIEIRCGEEIFIFDAGSGIRELGLDLLKAMPIKARLFFTHYHWDHILGFPFFVPAYIPTNEFDIYGEDKGKLSPKEILSGQMVFPYFPVTLDAMRAKMTFHTLKVGSILEFGDVRIKTHRLNHPFDAMGYRVEYKGSSVAYITDYEHFDHRDEPLVEFVKDADAMIYDSAFNEAEYVTKQGWGHSTWEQGVKLAQAGNVKFLVISHHEPTHDDSYMEKVEIEAKEVFPNSTVAREKHEFWF
ncbi:MAG: MBL fold metallo-hydrolase [Acidobacteria bacterium]|nr:MBL fold metallo-hydrolase [Acidobacteriota bacterium]